MTTFKVIIAGGRSFCNFKLLEAFCDKMLSQKQSVEIVSGTARGADQLGEKYATLRGHTVSQFPADWAKFGNSAGYKRNVQMAEYADALIAFWDGASKGTNHMIQIANQHNLKIRVCRY